MTSLNESNWQNKTPIRIGISTISNGYIVYVMCKMHESGPVVDPATAMHRLVSRDVKTQETFFAATGDEVAALIKECMCGKTPEEGGAL